MDIEKMEKVGGIASKIVVLLVLVIVLVGILTWMGIIRCSVIPGWCDAYYTVMGEPEILILYGDDGLGDPFELQRVLADPAYGRFTTTARHIKFLSGGNLYDYDLVFVERAKTLSTFQIEFLMDYVDKGGKLIWIADAGTKGASDSELLKESEKIVGGKNEVIGQWARKKDNKIVDLEGMLGVRYLGNFCGNRKKNSCSESETTMVGKLIPTDRKNPLVYAMRQNVPLHGNFSLVQETSGVGTKRILNLDAQRPIYTNDSDVSIGNTAPIIVTSGLFGKRVVYFAIPPENFVSQPNQYPVLLENIIPTMLK